MTLRTGLNTGNYIALCGELALEEAIDLSQDRLYNNLPIVFIYQDIRNVRTADCVRIVTDRNSLRFEN